MAYNTQAILIDKNGKPIPQYFNQLADAYQPLQGEHGAARNVLYGADGQPVSVVSNKLAVRAAELETALAQMLTGDNFDAKADIKLSALRDAITAAGTNAKTLKDLHDKLTSLETEIKAIKDTAGIKKIVDPLPAGTNKIGKIEVDGSALPTGAATAAKQDSIITELQAIKGKDFATQTTLAAILSKIIAAPATEAKQDSLLAAIQAITAKQDSGLFTNRPAANQVPAGFAYYAVDKPLGERASYSTGTAWEEAM